MTDLKALSNLIGRQLVQPIEAQTELGYRHLSVMDGEPKLKPQRGPTYLSITNASPHKVKAFEIITAMLSD